MEDEDARVIALLAECGLAKTSSQEWGLGPTKPLHQFLREARREAHVMRRDDRVVRESRTLRLLVEGINPETGEEDVLYETLNYPRELRMRQRPFDHGASLSETIWFDELILDAVLRALMQELGLPRLPSELVKPWLPPEHRVYESAAYPGVLSDVRYYYHRIWLPQEYVQPLYYSFEADILHIFEWRGRSTFQIAPLSAPPAL